MWKSGATAFPPPMWGRDREGGTTGTAVVFNSMPGKSGSKTPDFWNLRTEAGSRAVRCRHPPSLSLPHMGGGNRVARAFATSLSRTLRCEPALARRRGLIATKVSVMAGPATSPRCGVWVLRGDDSGESLLHIFLRGDDAWVCGCCLAAPERHPQHHRAIIARYFASPTAPSACYSWCGAITLFHADDRSASGGIAHIGTDH